MNHCLNFQHVFHKLAGIITRRYRLTTQHHLLRFEGSVLHVLQTVLVNIRVQAALPISTVYMVCEACNDRTKSKLTKLIM